MAKTLPLGCHSKQVAGFCKVMMASSHTRPCGRMFVERILAYTCVCVGHHYHHHHHHHHDVGSRHLSTYLPTYLISKEANFGIVISYSQ